MNCTKCNDTGIIKTGNNDLPCLYCPVGDRAIFNHAGVDGSVTGAEIKLHFLNDSPQPLNLGSEGISADDLPGRQ